MSELLQDRAKSLVDLFFAQRDEELLAALRGQAVDASNMDALRAHTGVTDDAVLADLVRVGVTPETLAAFSLVPMFAVAWSDRMLDDAERRAILLECIALGIASDSPAHKLVESWLSSEPNPALIAAWDDFAGSLLPALGASERVRMSEETMERARRVARASGGLLGIGATSASEQRAIAWLERVFGA